MKWVEGKGLATVVKGNMNTYLTGLPHHGSPLPFIYPSAPTNNPSTLLNGPTSFIGRERLMSCCFAGTLHTSKIFSATPIASYSNGTGITAAADCNSVRSCFPLAVIYSVFVGSIVFRQYLHVNVRRRVSRIWINPLTLSDFVVAGTIARGLSAGFWTV